MYLKHLSNGLKKNLKLNYKTMEATIKNLNGKWTVNGKTYNELSIHEIGMLNAFFADWRMSTEERCSKHCFEKIKQMTVNGHIVEATKVFDEIFQNPIEQLNNLL